MSEYRAKVSWRRGAARFVDSKYSRAHQWEFDGGAVVPASSSPHSVAPPYSDVSAVDPEEAFVAALSSCHMLWFLALAAKAGHCVEEYRDEAIGVMRPNSLGKLAVTEVRLRPHVAFAQNDRITTEEHDALHEAAHQECYIANSVTTKLSTEATFTVLVGSREG